MSTSKCFKDKKLARACNFFMYIATNLMYSLRADVGACFILTLNNQFVLAFCLSYMNHFSFLVCNDWHAEILLRVKKKSCESKKTFFFIVALNYHSKKAKTSPENKDKPF